MPGTAGGKRAHGVGAGVRGRWRRRRRRQRNGGAPRHAHALQTPPPWPRGPATASAADGADPGRGQAAAAAGVGGAVGRRGRPRGPAVADPSSTAHKTATRGRRHGGGAQSANRPLSVWTDTRTIDHHRPDGRHGRGEVRPRRADRPPSSSCPREDGHHENGRTPRVAHGYTRPKPNKYRKNTKVPVGRMVHQTDAPAVWACSRPMGGRHPPQVSGARCFQSSRGGGGPLPEAGPPTHPHTTTTPSRSAVPAPAPTANPRAPPADAAALSRHLLEHTACPPAPPSHPTVAPLQLPTHLDPHSVCCFFSSCHDRPSGGLASGTATMPAPTLLLGGGAGLRPSPGGRRRPRPPAVGGGPPHPAPPRRPAATATAGGRGGTRDSVGVGVFCRSCGGGCGGSGS